MRYCIIFFQINLILTQAYENLTVSLLIYILFILISITQNLIVAFNLMLNYLLKVLRLI